MGVTKGDFQVYRCRRNPGKLYKTFCHGCFSHSAYVLVANPKKLLYTVANPARGLLNREMVII